MNQSISGTLYIVASPIGNLQDITYRAVNILGKSDVILVEDTRRSRILCRNYNITPRFKVFNEHNEQRQVPHILDLLAQGLQIALLSDAGTPLISDPGYRLVAAARNCGVKIVPIPGPCAAIAAVSVSGLPTDKFIFEGFLPPKTAARKKILAQLKHETRTLIFYEAPHRITATVQDMQECLGQERSAVLARELTKVYETIYLGSLQELALWMQDNPEQRQGEMVLLIAGATNSAPTRVASQEQILPILLAELPLTQAVSLASKLTGIKKNTLYRLALHQAEQ